MRENEIFREGVNVELRAARAGVAAQLMLDQSGLSRREIARRMGSTPAKVRRMVVKGIPYHGTLNDVMRLAMACGYRVDMKFNPVR